MAKFKDFIDTFSAENKEKGDQFEVYVKWFLENDKYWQSEVDEVWMWDDWDEKWSIDKGIDLVYRDKNGNFVAVQAKKYSEEYPIKKSDLDSFYSESSRPIFKSRLLMATTNKIGPNAKETTTGQEKPVSLYMRSDFESSATQGNFHNSYDEFKRGITPKIKPIDPYPYQKPIIESVVSGFKTADRGKLIMACGTGKTFTTLWIDEDMENESTLILLPSISLLSQTLTEWRKASKHDFKSLCVCSDTTVESKAIKDTMMETTKELYFETTTDSTVILDFLKEKGKKVIFSTYQSSEQVAEAMCDPGIKPFDLIIADEAHRCTGDTSKKFSIVLDNNILRAKKRLFCTATPRIFSSRVHKKAKAIGTELASMDNEEMFGAEFYNLGFARAIKEDILTDYRVVVTAVDSAIVKSSIDNQKIVEYGDAKKSDAKTYAQQIALIKAIKKYEISSVISFHNTIKKAKDFSNEIIYVNKDLSDDEKVGLKSSYVDGTFSPNKRVEEIDKLKNVEADDTYLLSNSRCLSEGIDVPSLDGIAFIDPKNSEIDIIQAVGRVIRKSKTKTQGTIVIPIFISNAEDGKSSLENGDFQVVARILNALKAHDSNLEVEINELRTELGQTGKIKKTFTKIHFDLPEKIGIGFRDSIKTKVVQMSSDSWDEWYGILKAYIDEHGEMPAARAKYKGMKIGGWCTNQRTAKKGGDLPAEKIKLLDALDFVWDMLEQVWTDNYAALKAYIDEHGEMPAARAKYRGMNLGTWCNKQRTSKKKGKLPAEKIKLLDDIGFVWDILEQVWTDNYAALKTYIDEHRKMPAAIAKYKGKNIGTWCTAQRVTKKKGDLSDEKIKLLDDIGFVWDPKEQVWTDNYAALKTYIDEHGEMPGWKAKYRGMNLGKWCDTQRTAKKGGRGDLSDEKIKLLDDIGFVWDQLEQVWTDNYAALKAYIDEHGKMPAARAKYKGMKIGAWCNTQRVTKKKGDLSDEKIKLLDDIGFVWDMLEQVWTDNYAALKAYIDEHGKMPATITKYRGMNLGTWCTAQRTVKKKGDLPDEKIKLLDDIGFVWDMQEQAWTDNYAALKAYIDEHGEIPATITKYRGMKIGNWCNKQRGVKKKGDLPAEKIKLLDALDFVWDPQEQAWPDNYAVLKAYIDEHGEMPAARAKYKGTNIGGWCTNQRTAKKKGDLPAEKMKLLDALDFRW